MRGKGGISKAEKTELENVREEIDDLRALVEGSREKKI